MSEPIENFSISAESLEKATIYYTRGDKDFEQLIEIEVDYSAGEAPSRDCPGWPAEIEITDAFGLSVEERHHWDKWMAEYWGLLELELFELVEKEMADNAADKADYQYQQMKDKRAEEMMQWVTN